LTAEDKKRAETLKLGLQGTSETKLLIDTFHNFIRPLLYPKKAALRPAGSYSKWHDPLECMYAIAALRKEDGLFKPAENVTQTFAVIKYLIRGIMLYQAVRVNEQDHLIELEQ